MKYLNRKFSVPIQVDISQEEWDAIFKPSDPGSLDEKHPGGRDLPGGAGAQGGEAEEGEGG